MARLARSTLVGYPHHVTQRGNYDQDVFEEAIDFQSYLMMLQDCAIRYSIDIWAFCLMRNHVHFVCVPKAEGALSHGFNTLHMKYAQYFHAKKGLTGHLWRGRFLSCILDEKSMLEEVRFIENDPVRAGLVLRAQNYAWSSARHHVYGGSSSIITENCSLRSTVKDWTAYLTEVGDKLILNRTWQSLKTGRPSGDLGFVHLLEEIIGKQLVPRPRGRPKKDILTAVISRE
jgi:putative transposase